MDTDHGAQVDAKPKWVLVLALRMVSLCAAYGLWMLSRWLYTAKPVDAPLGIALLTASALLCAFFLLLGAVAPDRIVTTTWKTMSKGLFYILMFT